MPTEDDEDTTIYNVVINHEEQYSIWPADRENALGWRAAGKTGLKAECLAYIETVWTDMRPLSLRRHMEEMARAPRPEPDPDAEPTPEDDLVQRLATGSHPVEVNPRPNKTVDGLRACIDRGYVPVNFPNTQGGTELGVRLDQTASDLRGADFANATGTAHLVGGLTLNYVKVRCVADIDLATLSGQGHLEIIEAE